MKTLLLVCALYGSGGQVVAVYLPENPAECRTMQEENLHEIAFPRSMFGSKTPAQIAWEIQHLVPAMVSHAQARD